MLNAIAPSVAVTGVTVSPSQFTLNYGQTQQLTAVVSPANATNKAVTWSSSNPGIASVSATGLVTAGTITEGTASITVTTIDRGISAQAAVTVSSPYIFNLLRQLESVASTSPDVLVGGYPFHTAILDFLRHVRYNNTQWALTLFEPVRTSFIQYVQNTDQNLFNELFAYIREEENLTLASAYGQTIDLAHLAATTQGYSSSPLVPDFWTGWGGDLASAMANVTALIQNGGDALDAAIEVIGNSQYSFSLTDLNADIDAILLAASLGSSIADTMDEYFRTITTINRRDALLADIGFDGVVPTEQDLTNALNGKMTGILGFSHPGGFALKQKATYDPPDADPIEPTDTVIQATCQAFAGYILNL